MTPQSVLEFAQPGYSWTHSVNQLCGEDFWTLFERLQTYRLNYPRSMTPAEATNLLLSTQLDIDLRGKPIGAGGNRDMATDGEAIRI